jgi:pimeloyl-ACP methyl ester carboxylesterase
MGAFRSIRCASVVPFLLATLSMAFPAQVLNPWEILPPTPSLPTPKRTGMVPTNGVRIWYAIYGRGAPVILLHGGLANSNYWGMQIPALASHYQVIVIDSRGHGRSTWDYRPISYHLMASDVIAVMDALYIPKAMLVGWSDGGIIGLDIAIHHPERLTRLFAFGANSNLAGVKSAEGSAVFAEYDARTKVEYQNISATPEDFDRFTAAMGKMWDSEPDFSDADLRGITVPTWIVDGEYDEIIKREDADRMARLIPGAHELILPRTSHMAFLQDPEQFTEALLKFLSGR